MIIPKKIGIKWTTNIAVKAGPIRNAAALLFSRVIFTKPPIGQNSPVVFYKRGTCGKIDCGIG